MKHTVSQNGNRKSFCTLKLKPLDSLDSYSSQGGHEGVTDPIGGGDRESTKIRVKINWGERGAVPFTREKTKDRNGRDGTGKTHRTAPRNIFLTRTAASDPRSEENP